MTNTPDPDKIHTTISKYFNIYQIQNQRLIMKNLLSLLLFTLLTTITGCASITLPDRPAPVSYTMQTDQQAIANAQPKPTSNWIQKSPINFQKSTIQITLDKSRSQESPNIVYALTQKLAHLQTKKQIKNITAKNPDLKLILTITPTTTKQHTINYKPVISDDEYKRYDIQYTKFVNIMNKKIARELKQEYEEQYPHASDSTIRANAVERDRQVEIRKAKRKGKKFNGNEFHKKHYGHEDHGSFGDEIVGGILSSTIEILLDIPSVRELINYKNSVPSIEKRHYQLRQISEPKQSHLKQ